MKNIRRSVCMAAILLMTAFIFSFCNHTVVQKAESKALPIDGVLDMTGFDYDGNYAASLGGEWDFYWDRLLSYQGLQEEGQKPDLKVKVPKVWNSYSIDGKKLSGLGSATYRLHVINAVKGVPLAIRITTVSTAYRLFVNDTLLAENGRVSLDRKYYEPGYDPKVIGFVPEESEFDIIVQASNYIYARGGMWYALYMGTQEEISELDRAISNRDFLLIGSLTIMALLFSILFILRPEDKSSLYFMLLCLMIIGRVVIYGSFIINSIGFPVTVPVIVFIDYLILNWIAVVYTLMIGRLFPGEIPDRVLRILVTYAGAVSVFILVTPIRIYTSLTFLFEAVLVTIGSYVLYVLCKAYMKYKKEAAVMLVGVGVMLCSGIHDILYQSNFLSNPFGEMSTTGFMIALLLQSVILALRFSDTYGEVKQLTESLLKMDKLKDEFLANTSHELRTPLSGIIGIAEAMLMGSEGSLNEGQKRNLCIVADSGRRLSQLVNNILDYSRLKIRDIELDIKPVRLTGIIPAVLDVFRKSHISSGIELICELPQGLPMVLGDENRVVQILYNLIGNAVKFTEKGAVKISAKVRKGMVEICVADTGIGIDQEKLESVFMPFTQSDASITRRYGGTGLGLSISKQLVELQNGEIWVESIKDAGCRFYFTLPVARQQVLDYKEPTLQEITLYDQETPLLKYSTGKGPHILLVDDDVVNLQSAIQILKTADYRVSAVTGGAQAIEMILADNEFSLVILDVMLPGISGYEVCRKIRESKSYYDLPVLMLTAKSGIHDIVAGFDAGTNEYLSKPFEAEELLVRVKSLIHLKESVDMAKQAETAFLQAQIKPHFLFNALNTISSLCDTDPAQARDLIDSFSLYLRQSFDFKSLQRYVPIERELCLVDAYVKIEKARFGDELNILYDIDKEIKGDIMPLSIQPLVENAVLHGLRKKPGKGTVEISIKRVEGFIEVAVRDDGAGIPGDKLAGLFEHKDGSGVGLKNIEGRLTRLYNTRLCIESKLGEGTRVSFRIPGGGV